MGRLKLTEEIAAPRETVFDLATDLPHAAEHISGIEKIEMLTQEPMGVGARWRETRTLFGRTATEELVVTRYDRPNSYTVASESCGASFECRFQFDPSPAGTRVALEVDWRPVTVFAKLMSPLGGMMANGAKKAMQQDLSDLKRAAESRAG